MGSVSGGHLTKSSLEIVDWSVRPEPFDQVVATHGPMVLRVCRALLGPVDADDAWSETFLAALRAYPDLRPGSNVAGWLATIAHNKAIDQIRRNHRAPVPVDSGRAVEPVEPVDDGPSNGASLHPVDEDLRAAFDGLAPKQRAAVAYHHLAGLPYAEVGRILGTSEAAARRNAADGIAKLRNTYLKGNHR